MALSTSASLKFELDTVTVTESGETTPPTDPRVETTAEVEPLYVLSAITGAEIVRVFLLITAVVVSELVTL